MKERESDSPGEAYDPDAAFREAMADLIARHAQLVRELERRESSFWYRWTRRLRMLNF